MAILTHSALSDKANFLRRNSTVVSNDNSSNSTEPKEYFGNCFMKMKNNFYDLNPFNTIKPSGVKATVGEKVLYNFCSDVDTNCNKGDALVVTKGGCKRFAGKANQDKQWTLTQNAKNQSVITLRLPQGDVCANGQNYVTTYILTCNPKVNYHVNNTAFNPNSCENTIKIASKYACSQGKFSAWWNQFGLPKQALAAILILVGLYFLFFAAQFQKVSSLMINSSILGLILYSFINLFTPLNMLICMLIGVAIAFGVVYFESLNGIVLGIVVGYLFGSLFYNLEVKFVVGVNPQALYWGTLGVCIIFISVAGGFMQDYMVALSSSLVGAYAFVRGISVYAGGYPDETYVMKLISMKEYSQFGRVFGPKIYLYIGGIFALTAIGMITQSLFIKPKEDDKTKQPATNEGGDNNANINAQTKPAEGTQNNDGKEKLINNEAPK